MTMDPITIVGTLLGGLLSGGLFKAKPYCLWVKPPNGIWAVRNPAGNSARRCKKAKKVLIDSGLKAGDIIILPKGMMPI